MAGSKTNQKSAANDSLGLIGQSGPFRQVIEAIKQVAPTAITVLITGESGTGKEMVASAIHRLSTRSNKPLLTVNCGAIPEGILESELFGHEKGSFTGAVETRKGYFEAADGGILFLDEIGELPQATQVKLLRVLENKELMRVGGSKPLRVDVRVLAATNKNLEEDVRRGSFRQDLFYRLNAVKITVPPLRERHEDIRPLAEHFADEICRENDIRFQGFTQDAFAFMEAHPWPGNIRELRNVIERIIILEKGKQIDKSILESHIGKQTEPELNLPVLAHKTTDQAERELIYRALIDLRMVIEEIRAFLFGGHPRNFEGRPLGTEIHTVVNPQDSATQEEEITIKEMEKIQIEKALDKYRGNRRKTAKALGIGERTLYRKLKEYGLE